MTARWQAIGFDPNVELNDYCVRDLSRVVGLGNYDPQHAGSSVRVFDLVFLHRVIAAKHFELPDAPNVSHYLEQTVTITLDLLFGNWWSSDIDRKSGRCRKEMVNWYCAFSVGLLSAFLLGRWEDANRISEYSLQSLKRTYIGPFDEDFDLIYLLISGEIVGKFGFLPESEMLDLLLKSRNRRARDAVHAWRCFKDANVSGFTEAIKEFLKRHRSHCKKLLADEYAGNSIEYGLAQPICTLVLLAESRGMPLGRISPRLSDYLVSRQSLGIEN
ncbi:MAG: hypothetical protein KDB00_17585 [Planctomycetales bacterium]|nr:hypothetical protein [Planctomycetales bacterium]